MAVVRLLRYEVEEGELPGFCMRCGAPTALTRAKTFSWHPGWIDTLILVGLIIFHPLLLVGLILAVAMTKRMRVAVPLCEAHRNHWRWRACFIWGGLAAVAALGIGAGVFLAASDPRDELLREAAGWTCAATVVLGLVWLIAAAIVQNGAIRASEITDDRISLMKVSPAFVEVVEHARDEREEGFTDEGRPMTRRRHPADPDAFYEPKPHGRSAPPPDAYEAKDE